MNEKMDTIADKIVRNLMMKYNIPVEVQDVIIETVYSEGKKAVKRDVAKETKKSRDMLIISTPEDQKRFDAINQANKPEEILNRSA